MTTAPFDAESRSHLAAQAKDAGPWDPAWPLARQRQVWEAECRRARAKRPARLMVEDLDVEGESIEFGSGEDRLGCVVPEEFASALCVGVAGEAA